MWCAAHTKQVIVIFIFVPFFCALSLSLSLFAQCVPRSDYLFNSNDVRWFQLFDSIIIIAHCFTRCVFLQSFFLSLSLNCIDFWCLLSEICNLSACTRAHTQDFVSHNAFGQIGFANKQKPERWIVCCSELASRGIVMQILCFFFQYSQDILSPREKVNKTHRDGALQREKERRRKKHRVSPRTMVKCIDLFIVHLLCFDKSIPA